jgi:hypothetical protein
MRFSERYHLFYRHGILWPTGTFYQFKAYQEKARIYLDEYPEQEKERAIYFSQDTWRLIMKRFMEKL